MPEVCSMPHMLFLCEPCICLMRPWDWLVICWKRNSQRRKRYAGEGCSSRAMDRERVLIYSVLKAKSEKAAPFPKCILQEFQGKRKKYKIQTSTSCTKNNFQWSLYKVKAIYVPRSVCKPKTFILCINYTDYSVQIHLGVCFVVRLPHRQI